MTEYFRVIGKNLILFDTVGGGSYVQSEKGKPPQGLSEPLTRQETMGQLSKLPLEIRPHVLMRGLSIITFEITITGTTDADMEAKRHDLTETLEDTTLYFSTQGGRGTKAELLLKADGAAATSYKSIFYGTCEEQAGRDVLGPLIKEHRLYAVKITLYCEPYWRPVSAIELGPNEIKTPSFEWDSNADGLADNWTAQGAPVLAFINWGLQGCHMQEVTTDVANEGIRSATIVAPAGITEVVAYAWICRPAAGSDIKVGIWDLTAGVSRGISLFSTPGWRTKVMPGPNTFYRIVVSSNAIIAGNSHMLYIQAVAATPTVFYADMAFWKWGTIVCPDEWIDYYSIYNHEDTDVDHINHMDLADLKGDVEVSTQLKVQFWGEADELWMYEVFSGRRTRGIPCAFTHIYEGEAFTKVNWAAAAEAKCSGGNKVTDSANAAGNIWRTISLDNNQRGIFQCYARLKTNDKVNTKFRAIVLYSGVWDLPIYNPWVFLPVANKWQMVDLGTLYINPELRNGILAPTIKLRIEYSKDAIDLAELDYIFLLVSDEQPLEMSVTRKECVLISGEAFVINQVEDFNYTGIEDITTPQKLRLMNLRGDFLKLKPNVANRLYFYANTHDGTDIISEVHGAVSNLQFKIRIAYLPQYISPLE